MLMMVRIKETFVQLKDLIPLAIEFGAFHRKFIKLLRLYLRMQQLLLTHPVCGYLSCDADTLIQLSEPLQLQRVGEFLIEFVHFGI